MEHLHVAISRVPRQLVVTELIYCRYRKGKKQGKMLLKSEIVAEW